MDNIIVLEQMSCATECSLQITLVFYNLYSFMCPFVLVIEKMTMTMHRFFSRFLHLFM